MQKKLYQQGAALNYLDIGTGVAVMLIHGFAEDRRIWDNVIPALDNCRLIIPDLPGSGSSGLSKEITIESMGDALVQLLQHEQIKDAIIIGHSMGGYVTLAIAEKYPELVKAFGLFHSTAYADSEEKKVSRKKNIDFIRAHGSKAFLKQAIPGLFGETFKKSQPGFVDQFIEKYKEFQPDALVAYLGAMMQRPDRTNVLINTSKPVLFIIGRHDVAVPFEDSLKLCHLPSLSYIHTLDHSGHMGMIEDPETSINALKNFIKDLTD
jgi:pimeloyl-ACP methyl ester carboxylesterase